MILVETIHRYLFMIENLFIIIIIHSIHSYIPKIFIPFTKTSKIQ